jgi:hypothetical protein
MISCSSPKLQISMQIARNESIYAYRWRPVVFGGSVIEDQQRGALLMAAAIAGAMTADE